MFGRFSTNRGTERSLQLELVNLRHAEALGVATLVLTVPERSRLEVNPAQVDQVHGKLRELLRAERSSWLTGHERIRVAVIPTYQTAGAAGTKLLETVRTRVEETKGHESLHLVRLSRAGRSMDEADLALAGLSEGNPAAWRELADFFVWVGAPIETNASAGSIAAYVWDGHEMPTCLTNIALHSRAADEAVAWIHQRAPGALRRRTQGGSDNQWQRAVADSVWHPLALSAAQSDWSLSDEDGQKRWFQLIEALEAALFLNPGNIEAREALLKIRWGRMVEYAYRQRFSFRRGAASAWHQHVLRFGLAGGRPGDKRQREQGNPAAEQVLQCAIDSFTRAGGKLADGEPFDVPQAVAARWHAEQKRWLAELVLRLKAEPGIKPVLGRCLDYLAYDSPEPVEPTVQALSELLPAIAADPAAYEKRRSDPAMLQGVRQAFRAAAREGGAEKWLADLERAQRRLLEIPVATVGNVPLPRISALDSLAARPALDSGEVDYLPEAILVQPQIVQFPQPKPQEPGQIVALGGELWCIASGDEEVRQSSRDGNLGEQLQGPEYRISRLWRVNPATLAAARWTNGFGELQPQALAVHAGELWVALREGGVVSIEPRTGRTQDRSAGLNRSLERATAARSNSGKPDDQPDGNSVAVLAAGENLLVGAADRLMRFDDAAVRWSEVTNVSPRKFVQVYPSARRLAVAGNLVAFQSGPLRVGRMADLGWPEIPLSELGLDAQSSDSQPVLAVADRTGFWFATTAGLFWREASGTNTWSAPVTPLLGYRRDPFWARQPPSNIRPWNPAQEFSEDELNQIRSRLNVRKMGRNVGRLPGAVQALAVEGDFIWVAVNDLVRSTNRYGGHLMVLHVPSHRWLGRIELHPWPTSLHVAHDAVWIGTSSQRSLPGQSVLARLDKRAVLAVPEERWVPSRVSNEESTRREAALPKAQRIRRAFLRGDPQPLVTALGSKPVEDLDAESLCLLAAAHDEHGLSQQAKRAPYEEALLRNQPQSVYAEIVRRSQRAENLRPKLAARTLPGTGSEDIRLREIFERHDENQDSELQPRELSVLAELEPDQLAQHPVPGGFRGTIGDWLHQLCCKRPGATGVTAAELQMIVRRTGGPYPRTPGFRPPTVLTNDYQAIP